MNFTDRLLFFMENEGINDNQMTVNAGLSVGVIGKIRKGTTKSLSSANIEKILYAYPKLSAAWLMSGEGQMLKSEASTGNEMADRLLNIIAQKDAKLMEQAEEIGRLRSMVERLERHVELAHTEASAHAV